MTMWRASAVTTRRALCASARSKGRQTTLISSKPMKTYKRKLATLD